MKVNPKNLKEEMQMGSKHADTCQTSLYFQEIYVKIMIYQFCLLTSIKNIIKLSH